MRAALVIVAVAWAANTAHAGRIRGTVFADEDGDGLFGAGERGVATLVAWEDQIVVATDGDGAFTLDVPGDGLIWAHVPDGFVPGPAWAKVAIGPDEPTVDLALRPLPPGVADEPLSFVVAADTHLHSDQHSYGTPALIAAMAQATALEPPPRFFSILGDLTQANEPAELDQVAAGAATLAVPWVPVSGNHDWYDGGEAWRARLGPEVYSFEAGDAHFLVINTNGPDEDVRDFLELALGSVEPDRTIVVLGHHPLAEAVVDVMRERGVDLYLAGHWHASRAVLHGELLELDTEPFLMGGMDLLPAGYRVITLDDGAISVDHHTVVRTPWLRLAAPLPGRCLRAGEPLIVAAAIDARALALTARIGDETLALPYVGGWGYAAALPALRDGRYPVRIEARAGAAVVADVSGGELAVCHGARPHLDVGVWPQPGGGPAHLGRQDAAIDPPVVERWATPVGGPVAGGPVVAGGRVFVAVTDLARGDHGGVVALDAATGELLWRVTTPVPVRAAPVVVDAVVVASRLDGTVIALDVATGAERWRRALGTGLDAKQTTLYASPAADGGVIFVGMQRRFAALDAATGEERWSVDPVPNGTWHGSLAAPAVAGDLVVGQFERNKAGLQAWRRDGTPAWRVAPDQTYSMNASPVIDGDTVYVASGMGDALALDARDGTARWARMLTEDRHSWAYAIGATPAVADGVLVVATEHDQLWALDAATGDALWTWAPGPSPVLAAHYRGPGRGFAAAPVITGGLVWAGATDGTVAALDLHTGEVVQRFEVGAPIFASLAAAGDLLVVAGWDGTVHGFAHQAPAGSPPRTPLVELAAALAVAARAAWRWWQTRTAGRILRG